MNLAGVLADEPQLLPVPLQSLPLVLGHHQSHQRFVFAVKEHQRDHLVNRDQSVVAHRRGKQILKLGDRPGHPPGTGRIGSDNDRGSHHHPVHGRWCRTERQLNAASALARLVQAAGDDQFAARGNRRRQCHCQHARSGHDQVGWTNLNPVRAATEHLRIRPAVIRRTSAAGLAAHRQRIDQPQQCAVGPGECIKKPGVGCVLLFRTRAGHQFRDPVSQGTPVRRLGHLQPLGQQGSLGHHSRFRRTGDRFLVEVPRVGIPVLVRVWIAIVDRVGDVFLYVPGSLLARQFGDHQVESRQVAGVIAAFGTDLQRQQVTGTHQARLQHRDRLTPRPVDRPAAEYAV